MNFRQIIADASLIFVICAIFYFFMVWIYQPMNDDYEFQTITKISDVYADPIYLIFNWKTGDELQVGKLVTVWVEIRDLPYTDKDNLHDIEILFFEHDLNYFNSQSDLILPSSNLVFIPNWQQNIFISTPIDIRFISPSDITIQFCDYNLSDSCFPVHNIIRPAPHALAIQVDTNRIGLGISLIIPLLSSIIVWATLRNRFIENKIIFESEVKQIEKKEVYSMPRISPDPLPDNLSSSVVDFHTVIRNSQPMAFLASLSIIIAVFTFQKEDLPNVYPNAISGAFSFIFAFVTSILFQLLPPKGLYRLVLYFKFATYFFLGVGILYLLFIALAFSEDVDKISQTVSAWVFGMVAISSSILVWRHFIKLKSKEKIPSFDKLSLPIFMIIAIASWIVTGAKLSSAIVNFPVDDVLALSILIGCLAIFGFMSMSKDIILMIKKDWLKNNFLIRSNSLIFCPTL